jgi:hypothetical protein
VWRRGGGRDVQGRGGTPAKGPWRFRQGLGLHLESGAQGLQIVNGREMENEERGDLGWKEERRGERGGKTTVAASTPALTGEENDARTDIDGG